MVGVDCQVRPPRGPEVVDGLLLEANLFGLLSSTADMKEGTRAFLEKRPAAWVEEWQRS